MSISDQLKRQRGARNSRRALIVAALGVVTLGIFAFSLMWGEVFYSPAQVFQVLTGQQVPGASYTVGVLRLPRAVLGLAAGMAFGAAGVIFQTLLRNQLASPDIIGISSGASAAGVICIVFFEMSQSAVSAVALCAALLVALLIYVVAYRGGFSATRLILTGIGIAAMLNSVVSYSLSKADSWDLPTATRWLTGSLNGATWERASPLLLTTIVLFPILLANARNVDLMRLGADTAVSLGVATNRTRIIVIISAVALIAVATAACGPIAFVAFVAGPIATRLVGTGGSLIIPSACVGGLLVLSADLIGQYFLGTRYPVGVVTGVFGAPFLIYLLIHSNRAGAHS
ncbi:FecCD family ABC transporter permease [Corynebacterium crudilactis]|uniref:ABC transporter permease n=1 Tax=Corynebacterium crudilactis TaxID=1652495 RepID=A0A172QRM0_9CORY|nr:iron chelate uptake ABC transporter family permease subunit [Corynebacterium crudilactis]ANE03337.1 ABC transporter permease [Corynebacterium crudilactis]